MRRPTLSLLVLPLLALPCHGLAAPRLRVVAPSSATSGTPLTASVRIRPEDSEIVSWSFGFRLDGLTVREVTLTGTDFEQLSDGGYAETHVSADGTRVTSIGVLSFLDPVVLPPGEPEVLRAGCLVTRLEPGEARVIPEGGLDFPGNTGPVNNEVLLESGEVSPLEADETPVAVTGCAGFTVLPEGRDPADAPSPIEVRRGARVVLETRVHVESELHLQPTGFRLALIHNSSLLEILGAEFPEEFLADQLLADGFARVEIWERGFAASFLSSSTDPGTLAVGDTVVLRTTYRFPGGGRPGDIFRSRLRFAEETPLEDFNPTPGLQPGDALPCSTEDFPLELEVGPHHWIRGDVNVDAAVDISDCITLLQHLFLGGGAPCLRAMEINSDGAVDLSDAIYLLNHLFLGGDEPAAPFPECGPGDDTLPCEVPICPA